MAMLKLLLNACLEFCGTLCCSHLAGVPEEDKNKDRVKLKLLSEGGRLYAPKDVVTVWLHYCVTPLTQTYMPTVTHCSMLLHIQVHRLRK